MQISKHQLVYTLGALVLGSFTLGQAHAASFTHTGTFSADAGMYQYTFTLPTAQTLNIFTTSYAGGTNLDGSTSSAGGFVPSVTIFSNATGTVVDCAAAGTTCSGMAMGPTKVDATTGLANDVNLTETFAAGSYVLDLTEFPNVALGGINDGFLVSADPTLFTDACGAGMFLEADTPNCAQRTGNYSLNVGTVPEPATFWLAVPVLGFMLLRGKRLLARS